MMEVLGEHSADQMALEEHLEALREARAEETREDAWLAEGREDWA